MRKYISILMLVVLSLGSSACAASIIQQPHGPSFSNITLQQRVLVTVQNNCVPFLWIQSGASVFTKDLPYGESTIAPLTRQPFSNGEFILMVKGYDEKKNLLGTDTRRYNISSYDGEKNEVWEVNNLNLPNGKGRCP